MQNQLYILVPGIAGSKLYCGCVPDNNKRLYPRRGWFFNSSIHRHAHECRNILTKPLKTFWHVSIYERFINNMSANKFNKIEIFSYDWRRDPTYLAKELLNFVKSLNPIRFTHLKLIGHSLGGLLIRIMLECYNAIPEFFIRPEQIIVYQCGTPMYGSMNIHDYNYGFEMAAILASSGLFYSSCPLQKIKRRDIQRVKPFLFSIQDLRKIIETSSNSLAYLLPTPIIETMHKMRHEGQLFIKDCINFDSVYRIHQQLAELKFSVQYIYFYNISYHRVERVYIPFKGDDIFTKISVHDIQPGKHKVGCGLYLTRLLKSDGLVVPYSGQKIPHNCNVYVDESEKSPHAKLMNSTELWRLTNNSHTNYSYFNMSATRDDDDLPTYEDIILE